MRRSGLSSLAAVVALGFVACDASDDTPDVRHVTTSAPIAIANLDHQIAQCVDPAGLEELLFARARFLGDYEALDRAARLAERPFADAPTSAPAELVRRARARAAVHRFADALTDLAVAERAGANPDELLPLRASILVATGRAAEVVAGLEAETARHPGFGSRSALASAYAAVGRLSEADRLYDAALADLDTTSPFPYAWVQFARGLLWAEHGEPARGEARYAQAVAYLPQFAAANIHLAELEVARGALEAPIARLERVVAATDEPEALALLGQLHVRSGDPARGRREIAHARQRFESLLAAHPLAFADHAAEFFLGPGADPARAWQLAAQNLASRPTERAVALAIAATFAQTLE